MQRRLQNFFLPSIWYYIAWCKFSALQIKFFLSRVTVYHNCHIVELNRMSYLVNWHTFVICIQHSFTPACIILKLNYIKERFYWLEIVLCTAPFITDKWHGKHITKLFVILKRKLLKWCVHMKCKSLMIDVRNSLSCQRF